MVPAAANTPENLPLRDIHLPPAISWWPPAPGWWMLVLLILLLCVSGYWLLCRYRRRSYRRLALKQLQALAQQYNQSADSDQLLKGLSRLLRQAAQLHFPQSDCAGLIGDDWLHFLEQPLEAGSFSQGTGHVLAEGPYRRELADFDAEKLLELCRRWLQKLPLQPQGGRK